MMVGFRWIKVFLFLILMPHFTEVSGQYSSFFVVRRGDDITLPCDNVRNDRYKCDRTWFFSGSGNTATVTLFEHGQIQQEASKSDRLSVTENCSLVMKKVTDEDVGHYTCRQTKPGQVQDSVVHLSVVPTTTGSFYSSVTVRNGDDATLPCDNVIDNHDKCYSSTFVFSDSTNTGTVELITHGQIGENAKSQSDRLSVTENCSLVIKKVTDEDVGRYSCRQFDKSGRQQGEDSVVDVSVVTMTEHKDNNKVTLSCSVSKYEECRHTVKWLFDGNKNDLTDMETSQHFCSVTATLTSHLKQKMCYDLLKCEVTDATSKKVQQFTFRPQCSGEDTKKTTTAKSTSTETTVTVTNNKSPTNKRNSTRAEGESGTTRKSTTVRIKPTPTKSSEGTTKNQPVWPRWIIIVAVSFAALIITVVAWKKTKGKKTQKDENVTDPEDGVSYASISYTKKNKSKALGRSNNDAGDTVTYSTVKASSSSGQASTDPMVTYAAINKPKK